MVTFRYGELHHESKTKEYKKLEKRKQKIGDVTS